MFYFFSSCISYRNRITVYYTIVEESVTVCEDLTQKKRIQSKRRWPSLVYCCSWVVKDVSSLLNDVQLEDGKWNYPWSNSCWSRQSISIVNLCIVDWLHRLYRRVSIEKRIKMERSRIVDSARTCVEFTFSEGRME